jgi:AcrR family transcriptional regulator
MAETTKPRVPRGPNAERRAATRAKIMDATVRCLAEFGYAATSTPLVARLAKVSRGSLLHQFPTKIDLILGVATYAARAQGAFVEARIAHYTTERDRFVGRVDAVWESLQQPEAIALTEIRVATRSDPELAQRYPGFADDLVTYQHRRRRAMAERLGAADRAEEIDVHTHMTLAALRGLAMETLFTGKPSAEVSKAVAMIRALRVQLADDL